MNLNNHTIVEALSSGLFTKLKSSDILNTPHNGGCVLWHQREQVASMSKADELTS
jgi:hypothetical protein